MEFLKRFLSWLVGLFKDSEFEEVPEPSDPKVVVVDALPPRSAEDVLTDPPKFTPLPPDPPKLPEDFIFSCNDGTPVPPALYGNASLLATNLRVLSKELGEPLVLVSVYRTEGYNKHVGGKPNSAHTACLAADFTVSEWELTDVANKIKGLVASGMMSCGTVAVNPGFVHYEITKIA